MFRRSIDEGKSIYLSLQLENYAFGVTIQTFSYLPNHLIKDNRRDCGGGAPKGRPSKPRRKSNVEPEETESAREGIEQHQLGHGPLVSQILAVSHAESSPPRDETEVVDDRNSWLDSIGSSEDPSSLLQMSPDSGEDDFLFEPHDICG